MKPYPLLALCALFVLSCQDINRSLEDGMLGLPPYRVAFSSSSLGQASDIYIIETDSKNLTTVTVNPLKDIKPVWFPDGKSLLFSSNRGGNWNFYQYSLELGTINQFIYGPGDFSNGSWSQDGSKFVYQAKVNGNEDIYLMDMATGSIKRLTHDPAVDYSPAWSPDGTRLAFVSMRDGNAEIYIVDSEGTNPVRITWSDLMDLEPSWSPDGTKIAFTTHRHSSDEHVYVVNSDGSELVQIPTAASDEYNPIWSSNGLWIYYYNILMGKIFKSPSNGQGNPEIIFDFGRVHDLRITPDNKALIFVAKINDNSSVLHILNLETGDFQYLNIGEYWDKSPSAIRRLEVNPE